MITTAAGTLTISLAKETGNTSTVGNNRACSNGGSRKNRDSNGTLLTESRVCPKKPLCYEHR